MTTSAFLLICALLPPQQATPDQHMQALVEEVRQLRQTIQTMLATTQRAQLIVYRMQAQEASVTQAIHRVDDAKSRIAGVDNERRDVQGQLKLIEERLGSISDPAERKRMEDVMAGSKHHLEALAARDADLQTGLSEAQDHLRQEQIKLSTLQDRLDRLDKDLESAAKPQQP